MGFFLVPTTATSLHLGFHQRARIALKSHHNFPSIQDPAPLPLLNAAGAFQMSAGDER